MSAILDHVVAHEFEHLAAVLGAECARRLATAPGGWRTVSEHELDQLGVRDRAPAVRALQALTGSRSRPVGGSYRTASEIAAIYTERLDHLDHEVVICAALDGTRRLLWEGVVATGGRDAAALSAGDVLRPLIRAGAGMFLLVHNHPSGDPAPSAEDIDLTRRLCTSARLVGLLMVDHIIIGGRGGGWCSLAQLFEGGLP